MHRSCFQVEKNLFADQVLTKLNRKLISIEFSFSDSYFDFVWAETISSTKTAIATSRREPNKFFNEENILFLLEY